MDRQDYQAWLTEIDDLSPAQRLDTARLLAGQPSLEAVIGLLEERIGAERGCPHCAAAGAVIRGRANGLKRYFCKACGKTFNALTGTPLARLRRKDCWTEFAASLSEGETVKASAERCGVAGSNSLPLASSFPADGDSRRDQTARHRRGRRNLRSDEP